MTTIRKAHPRTLPNGKVITVGQHKVSTPPASSQGPATLAAADADAAANADPFGAPAPAVPDMPPVVRNFDPGTATQEVAFDRCYDVHTELARQAEDAGHDVRVLHLTGPTDPMPDAHPQWRQLDEQWAALDPKYGGQARWVHYVTEIDGVAYDFTARQFDPDADYPAVIDPDTWREKQVHVQLPSGFAINAAGDEDPARVRAAATWADDTGQSTEEVLDQWRRGREQARELLGPSPTFVHFTDEAGAHAIASEGRLRSGTIENTVYAVPAGGEYAPWVQQGTTSERGFGKVRGGRHYAVVFTTDAVPEAAWAAETWWKRDQPLALTDAFVVSADDASGLLDGSLNLPDL